MGKEWMAAERMLSLLLKRLPNVQKLHLQREAAMRIMWTDLPFDLTNAIGTILACLSLTELKLVGVVFDRPGQLLKVLSGCRSLKRLDVVRVLFENNYDAFPVPQRTEPPVQLDALTIGARTSSAFVDCILHAESTVDITSLRGLSISISSGFADFARLLKACTSVESLELVLMNDIDLQSYWPLLPSDRFDLGYNTHLRSLTVRIDVIQQQDDPLPWLNALFSTVSSPNSLQSIHIVYSLYLPSPYMDRHVNTTIFSEWRHIDTTLAGPEFEHLKTVRLEFSLENPIGFDVAPRFLKEVDLVSPELERRGILLLEAFDTSR